MRLDPIKDKEFLDKIKDKGSGKSIAQLYADEIKNSKPPVEKRVARVEPKKITRKITYKRTHAGDSMTLVLPYGVSTNAMHVVGDDGRRHLTKEGRAFKNQVRLEALRQKAFVLTGPVKFTLRVFRPIRRGDLSNRVKLLEDALKGIAWIDDEQVKEIHLYRSIDREDPRIEMQITQID